MDKLHYGKIGLYFKIMCTLFSLFEGWESDPNIGDIWEGEVFKNIFIYLLILEHGADRHWTIQAQVCSMAVLRGSIGP